MTAKKKQYQFLVTVSVPADMTKVEAKREVRLLISHQCNYAAFEGDVTCKKVEAAPRAVIRAAMEDDDE